MLKKQIQSFSLSAGCLLLCASSFGGTYSFGTGYWVSTPSSSNGGYIGSGCSYGVTADNTKTNGTLNVNSTAMGTYRWPFTFTPSGGDQPVVQDYIARVSGFSKLETYIQSYVAGSFQSSISVLEPSAPITPILASVSYSNLTYPPGNLQQVLGTTTPSTIGDFAVGFTAQQQPNGTWTGYYFWQANLLVSSQMISNPNYPTYAPSRAKAQVGYTVTLVAK